MASGGDSLEENFVFDNSESDGESIDQLSGSSDNESPASPRSARTKVGGDGTPSDEADLPSAKKAKFNWREAAVNTDGSSNSQIEILSKSLEAVAKFFPNEGAPFEHEDLAKLSFVDLTSFSEGSDRSVSNLIRFLQDQTGLLKASKSTGIETLFITSTSIRGMYFVKELRDSGSSVTPLPLFFHGGGRKKEQSKTHESVLKSGKASVAVCMPSRLRAVSESGLLNYENIKLVVIDLKQDAKRLNVLSQKETMMDLLRVIGDYILPSSCPPLVAMI